VAARALLYGGILTVAVALVGSIVGYLVAGGPGVASALVGAAVTAGFMGLTALSVLIAARATKDKPGSMLFFGIILGIWVLKFVAFVVVLVALRGQPWLNPLVFLIVLIVAVAGSLVSDMVALQASRVPYVGDIELPRASSQGGADS
jgi:hypothetical protein